MYESTAVLLSDPVATYDTYGNEVLTHDRVEVFVKPRSVYASEFYQAAQVGLHPSIVLVLGNRADYDGQKLVEYEGKVYDVIRADWTNGREAISLTLEERIGHDGD